MARKPRDTTQCLFCERPAVARKLCSSHYAHAHKAGTLNDFPDRQAKKAFDLRYVKKESGCWEWTGARNGYGYGLVCFPGGKQVKAHRYAYEQRFGPIPPGLVVMHSCDNPPCVNPDHLSVGTRKDNRRDSIQKRRHVFGDAHHWTKLTVSQVQEVRALLAAGEMQRSIARRFNVDPTTISNIKTGKSRSQYA